MPAVHYRISEDDYASANRLHAWRHFIARPSATSMLALGVVAAMLVLGVWERVLSVPVLILSIAAIAIFSVFLIFVRVPGNARRHYRQYKAIQEVITAELTDAGIRFSNADGEAVLPWSKLLQWRQNDRFVLIYPMPILFYIVPKSIERDGFDIPLLIQRLAEHIGPER